MTTPNKNCAVTVEEIISAKDSADILKSLKKWAQHMQTQEPDLFLYSEDLDSFFFPSGTSGQLNNKFREAFLKIPASNLDIANIEKGTEIYKEMLAHHCGENFNLFPIKNNNKFFGFLAMPESENNKEIGEIMASVTGAGFAQQFQKLQLEKAIIENQILRKNMIRGENLKLLGEMIGGITHDFNNILTGVTGFSQLIQMMTSDEETLDSVSEILKAAEDGKKIVNFLSRTKKIDGEEQSQRIKILDTIKEAAYRSRYLLEKFQPGVTEEEFFSLQGENADIEMKPTLAEQLFLQLFAGFIKAGVAKLFVKIEKNNEKIYVKIQSEEKTTASSEKIPLKLETCDDFPTCLILYELVNYLNFNFDITENSVTLEIPPQPDKYNPEGGLRVLIFEPDADLAKMFCCLLKKMALECKISTSIEEFKTYMQKNFEGFDRIIADSAAFPIISESGNLEKFPLLAVSGSWGQYMDMEKMAQAGIKRFLPKPFSTRGLKKVLK